MDFGKVHKTDLCFLGNLTLFCEAFGFHRYAQTLMLIGLLSLTAYEQATYL